MTDAKSPSVLDHVKICIPTGQVVARIPTPLVANLPADVGIGRRALLGSLFLEGPWYKGASCCWRATGR